MGHVPQDEPRAVGQEEGQTARDEELVKRAQGGEVAAFEELLRRHQRRMFSIVGGILRGREDVEDVVQQVCIKVFLSLKRFDRRSAFSTWLYKVTVNECWDYLRKKRARPLVYEADLVEDRETGGARSGQESRVSGLDSRAAQSDAPDAAQRAEMRDLLDRLLGELSEDEQTMLMLKEVEGFSVEEIGEVFGLNVNTVKVRLFRARGRLVRRYHEVLEKRRGKNKK